jgi:2-polyprenyl-3-methyl-5-hydroxy-6-metoxy-1,4-benzoquinol methylase
MVTGRIVEHSSDDGTYMLPAEHAMMLTKAAGPDNMAAFARLIPILSSVHDGIIDSFHNGGGVPYDRYDDFLGFFADYTAQVFDRSLVSKVMPLMPAVEEELAGGIEVLDIGCGTGHSTNVMAKAYPDSRFTGYEFRDRALDRGRVQAESLGLNNVRFLNRDLVKMEESTAFDLVTAFDVIHDQAEPRKVLRNVVAALRPGGTFLMVDIKASSHVHDNVEYPMSPFLYTTSTMHCMTVSLAQGGEGLGSMWGEQKAVELLTEAGFENVAVQEIEGDVFNNYYIAVRP